MKIDIVYTWVNHLDKDWQRLYGQTTSSYKLPRDTHESVNNIARFQNRNELYYSIKSIKKYAPWFNHIYIVTNCTLPEWAQDDTKITHIPHEKIFPNLNVLPSFNSRAIESSLHRIPELSEHFLYLNDDFFISQNVSPNDFFPDDGQINIFPSKHDMPYNKKNLRPIDHGALNACRLLQRDYNYTPIKKLHHAPYPLLKSKLIELNNKYTRELSETRKNKFRNPSDLPLATTLHAYYCAATGCGQSVNINARYIDIGDPLFIGLTHPLSPLMRKKYTFFCLNEVTALKHFAKFRDRYIEKLLRKITK